MTSSPIESGTGQLLEGLAPGGEQAHTADDEDKRAVAEGGREAIDEGGQHADYRGVAA